MRLQNILKIPIFFFLVSIILLSPILLGSVDPFSKMLLRLQIALIFVIWVIQSYLYGKNLESGLKTKLFFLFIFLCIFQIVPLPAFLIKILSPSSYEIWNFNNDIFSKFDSFSSNSFHTISLVPHHTMNEIISFLSYFALGIVIAKTLNTKYNILFIIYVFGFIVFVESMLGLSQFLEATFADDTNKQNIATGSFVNKNHLAGFFELTVPVIIGYLIYRIFYSDEENLIFSSAAFKTIEITIISIFCCFSLIVFIFTFSRMGYLSLFTSIIISFVIYTKIIGDINKKTFIPIIFIAILLLFGINKSFDIFTERVSINNINIEGRAVIFKDTVNAIKDFPLLGSGLGTFKEIYPKYKTLEEAKTVNFAHNDYLQLTLETGIIGISVLLSALFLFFKTTLLKLQAHYKNDDKFYFFVKLGCLTGIISLLIHSLGDFNLHIPSNAAYFAILFGIIACGDNSKNKAKAKKKKARKKIKIDDTETIALPEKN